MIVYWRSWWVSSHTFLWFLFSAYWPRPALYCFYLPCEWVWTGPAHRFINLIERSTLTTTLSCVSVGRAKESKVKKNATANCSLDSRSMKVSWQSAGCKQFNNQQTWSSHHQNALRVQKTDPSSVCVCGVLLRKKKKKKMTSRGIKFTRATIINTKFARVWSNFSTRAVEPWVSPWLCFIALSPIKGERVRTGNQRACPACSCFCCQPTGVNRAPSATSHL